MTDKPRVVSEPAPESKVCKGCDVDKARTEYSPSQWQRGYCTSCMDIARRHGHFPKTLDKARPVIAPQPTPEPPTDAQIRAIKPWWNMELLPNRPTCPTHNLPMFRTQHDSGIDPGWVCCRENCNYYIPDEAAPQPTPRLICDGCNVRENWEHRCHGSNASVGGERTGKPCQCADCDEVAPPPTPEPPRIIGIDWAKGPDYTVFPCPHCKQEIKIEQLAAPQGVGKLSPEPLLWDELERATELRARVVRAIFDRHTRRRAAKELTQAELDTVWAADGKSRGMYLDRFLDTIRAMRDELNSNPKGVGGVGQTARELADDDAELFEAMSQLCDITQAPEKFVQAALLWANAQTLTLRAELQQAHKLLGLRIGRIGYLLACIKEFDERTYQHLANKLTPEEIGFSQLPQLVAELRSRLQEADELLADCRTYFELVTRGGFTDVALIMAKLNKWMEDSNAPRS